MPASALTFKKNQRRFKRKPNKNAVKSRAFDKTPIKVSISSLGYHGDGIASIDPDTFGGTSVAFVPNTLPGETVIIAPKALSKSKLDADVVEVLSASEARKDADCDVGDTCGGCQAQVMAPSFYQDWKSNLVQLSLSSLDLPPSCWQPTITSSYGGRRRARLAYRCLKDRVVCGFRERRSNHIVPPSSCVILTSSLMACIKFLTTELLPLLEEGSIGEVSITATDQGIDLLLHPEAEINHSIITKFIDLASKQGLSGCEIERLSIQEKDGLITPAFIKRQPSLTWKTDHGAFTLYPAAGTFLQADAAAEAAMQKEIFATLSGFEKILDVFCGSGTLSLPLLTNAKPPKIIQGFDTGISALEAMTASAKAAGFYHHVRTQERNLFKDPLSTDEINGFDAVIIDPPRAGAIQQMPAIAESDVSTVMMISCNPQTFARDAQLLINSRFVCKSVRMIDQFLLTPHSELIAKFERN